VVNVTIRCDFLIFSINQSISQSLFAAKSKYSTTVVNRQLWTGHEAKALTTALLLGISGISYSLASGRKSDHEPCNRNPYNEAKIRQLNNVYGLFADFAILNCICVELP